jgi:hypothetical protein
LIGKLEINYNTSVALYFQAIQTAFSNHIPMEASPFYDIWREVTWEKLVHGKNKREERERTYIQGQNIN